LKKLIKIILTLTVVFLILLFIPFCFYTDKGFLPDENFKPFHNSAYLRSGINRIHYRVWHHKKNTRNFFLIHGFSGSTFSFEKLAQVLFKNGYNVVAVDLPAFGFSEKSAKGDYSYQAYLNAIQSTKLKMDSICGINNYIVLGHSMGAMWACEAHYNGIFKNATLILVDGAVSSGSAAGGNSFMASLPIIKWADLALHQWFLNKERFKSLLSSAYSKEASDLEALGYMQPFLIKGSASAIFRMSANEFSSKGEWSKINAPVLLLCGDNDAWIPFLASFHLWERNKKSIFMLIPKAGHCPMETNTEETFTAIRLFIKSKGI
jgi:pimeloyl-ACP methyl ester carboxylesterase